MDKLQKTVTDFHTKINSELTIEARVLDLASECGEVSKLAFSASTGSEVTHKKWEEELGDTLYSLLSLMNMLNVDADIALNRVLQKYNERLIETGNMNSGH